MCYARHIVAVSDVGKSTSACNMVFIIITAAYLKFFLLQRRLIVLHAVLD